MEKIPKILWLNDVLVDDTNLEIEKLLVFEGNFGENSLYNENSVNFIIFLE